MMQKRIAGLMAAALVVGLWSVAGMAQGDITPTEPPAKPLKQPDYEQEVYCCPQNIPEVPDHITCLIYHRVGKDENLYLLAGYYYGDARAWRRIYNLNRDKIRDPNRIYEGQILRIELDHVCWRPRFPLAEFMEIERQRQALYKARAEAALMPEVERTQVVPTAIYEAPVIVPDEPPEDAPVIEYRRMPPPGPGVPAPPPPAPVSETDAPEVE